MSGCRLVLLLLPLAALAVALSGCSSRVPSIPPTARAQAPASGSPAVEWIARDGRLTFSGGGRRFSARVAVHRQADGRVRFGVITDEGVVLADLLVDGESVTAVQLRPEVEPAVGVLARLVRQAWAAPLDKPRPEDGLIIGEWNGSQRIYGGDPVLLRAVRGDGPDLEIEDYRLESVGLIAHTVRATSLGYDVQLTISAVGVPAANQPVTTPTAAAPSANLF